MSANNNNVRLPYGNTASYSPVAYQRQPFARGSGRFTNDSIAQARQAMFGGYNTAGYQPDFGGDTYTSFSDYMTGNYNPGTGGDNALPNTNYNAAGGNYQPYFGGDNTLPNSNYNIDTAPPGYTQAQWDAIPTMDRQYVYGQISSTRRGQGGQGGNAAPRYYPPGTIINGALMSSGPGTPQGHFGSYYGANGFTNAVRPPPSSSEQNAQLMAAMAYGGNPNYTGTTGDDGHNMSYAPPAVDAYLKSVQQWANRMGQGTHAAEIAAFNNRYAAGLIDRSQQPQRPSNLPSWGMHLEDGDLSNGAPMQRRTQVGPTPNPLIMGTVPNGQPGQAGPTPTPLTMGTVLNGQPGPALLGPPIQQGSGGPQLLGPPVQQGGGAFSWLNNGNGISPPTPAPTPAMFSRFRGL